LLQLVDEVQVSPPLVVDPFVDPLVDPLLPPFPPLVVDGIDMSGSLSGAALHQSSTCELAPTQSSHDAHSNSLPSAVW
jgi:hypothetical protein